MNVGTIISQLRKQNEMTQDEFAALFHVSRQTISNWENEKSYPDLSTLIHISEHFGISLDTLLKEDSIMVKKMDSYKKYKKYFLIFLSCLLVIILSAAAYLAYCNYSYAHRYDKVKAAGFTKELTSEFIEKYQSNYALPENGIDYLVDTKASSKYEIDTENFALFARDPQINFVLTIDEEKDLSLFIRTKNGNYEFNIDEKGNLKGKNKSLNEKERTFVKSFLSSHREELVPVINRSLELWEQINE